jgi:hypothetical protein
MVFDRHERLEVGPMKAYVVKASWDGEAGVWIATSEEIPGLCCEAPSFDDLVGVVVGLVPELLEANGIELVDSGEGIPVNVVAERHATAFRAA